MIAEVYPLKRMPRKFGVFDYTVPSHVRVERGAFVEIPFRSGQLFGVVAKTKDQPLRGIELKELDAVTHGIHLHESELAYFERLAVDLAQSVSSILHVAIPLPPKRLDRDDSVPFTQPLRLTIPSSEAPSITSLVNAMENRGEAFLKVPDLRRTAAVISGYMHEHPDALAMVIAPTVRDAKLLARALCSHRPLLMTGKESNNSRFAVWKQWQSMKRGILVGTRVAALLPHRLMTSVILIRSGHQNHKQEERNPRMDTRMASELFHEMYHARRFFIDVAPRVDEIAHIGEANVLSMEGLAPVEIVDMNKEGPTSPHPVISFTTSRAIEQTLAEGRQVICVYNKKGFSGQLKCADCGHTFPCQKCSGVLAVYEHTVRCHRCGHAEPIPISCPACRGQNLRPKGFGNRGVVRALENLYPGTPVSLVEKGSEADLSVPILVVTSAYYENLFDPFRPPPVGLVVELHADGPLFEPSLRAFEHAIISLEQWRGVAHACRARFIVQTQAPDMFMEYLTSPKTAYAREKEMRIKYDQPPARRWMRISHRIEESRKSEIVVRTLVRELRETFDQVLLIGPKQGSDGFLTFDIGCLPTDAPRILERFSTLDDAFVIDTNLLF